MKQSDIVAICSFIVAFGSGLAAGSPLAAALDTVTLGHGPYVLSVIALASFTAGCIIRVLANKTGAPATAITADAKVVAPDTPVVHDDTPAIGVNLTTAAPLKGP